MAKDSEPTPVYRHYIYATVWPLKVVAFPEPPLASLARVLGQDGLEVRALAIEMFAQEVDLLCTRRFIPMVLKTCFGDYTVGKDGVAFSLPAGTKQIIKTSDGL